MRTIVLATLAATLLLLLVPQASACPRATVYHGPLGQVCYIYWNELQTIPPEFYIETNGVLDGGISEGTIADHFTGMEGEPTGLQRGDGGDTQVDPATWLAMCQLR